MNKTQREGVLQAWWCGKALEVWELSCAHMLHRMFLVGDRLSHKAK